MYIISVNAMGRGITPGKKYLEARWSNAVELFYRVCDKYLGDYLVEKRYGFWSAGGIGYDYFVTLTTDEEEGG